MVRKRSIKKSPTKKTARKKTVRAGTEAKSRPRERSARQKAPQPVLIPVGVVTTSFRLPPGLLGKLRLAATQRRNRLDKPYSQSAIVEQAIGEWLDRNTG